MPHVVEVKDLRRDFVVSQGFLGLKKKTINAVKGISFSVNQGEIFGLLGQNGAGKTTTIKMLITMLAPTSGTCKVLGYEAFGNEKMIRPYINFIFGGEYGLYRRLSARDNLKYFANLYKISANIRDKRINELLELLEISDKADLPIETFSKGMTQRIHIARGLINSPQILFMDEPTIGLDPVGAKVLRKIIKDINNLGTTVLLTTHNMYEVDELCNTIAIIKEGELLALDTPERIKSEVSGSNVFVIELKTCPPDIINKIYSIEGVTEVAVSDIEIGTTIRISCKPNSHIYSNVLEMVNPNDIISFKKDEITLEDAYIQLVKRQ